MHTCDDVCVSVCSARMLTPCSGRLPRAFACSAACGRMPLSCASSSPCAHKPTRTGYFAYDTLECIVRYEQEGPEFLTHGVFCFIVFTSLVHTRAVHWFGAGFLMWELSTPFIHFRCVSGEVSILKCFTAALFASAALSSSLRLLSSSHLQFPSGRCSPRSRATRGSSALPDSAPLASTHSYPFNALYTCRWVLFKIARHQGQLYVANGLLGLLVFFLCRICWGPVLSVIYWKVRSRCMRVVCTCRLLWVHVAPAEHVGCSATLC